eukprot:7374592-Prorocentrum_lima.AAC.1
MPFTLLVRAALNGRKQTKAPAVRSPIHLPKEHKQAYGILVSELIQRHRRRGNHIWPNMRHTG